eukprot:TRINITY_DN3751_c0_g1_i1.p1 TRINITY_DN3751_c0_g1~~TRINITY_DN3751_c0_g1_i1.p1  ORF type:complete len:573 (+),score=165.71 TRINITY_DN3751_c0_g1_i1:33-1721(+)
MDTLLACTEEMLPMDQDDLVREEKGLDEFDEVFAPEDEEEEQEGNPDDTSSSSSSLSMEYEFENHHQNSQPHMPTSTTSAFTQKDEHVFQSTVEYHEYGYDLDNDAIERSSVDYYHYSDLLLNPAMQNSEKRTSERDQQTGELEGHGEHDTRTPQQRDVMEYHDAMTEQGMPRSQVMMMMMDARFHQVHTDAPELIKFSDQEAWKVIGNGNNFDEYHLDQLQYFLALERHVQPPSDYLTAVQGSIKPWMRQMTVEWMFEVCEYFDLTSDTCVVATHFLDRFLACKEVCKSKLQRYAAACLMIAVKLRETAIPRLNDVVESAGGGFTSMHLKMAERDVLKTLEWNLLVASPHTAFVLLTQHAKLDDEEEAEEEKEKQGSGNGNNGMLEGFEMTRTEFECLRRHTEFFLDLCACEYSVFLRYLPTVITAASMLLSADMIGYPRQYMIDALFELVQFDTVELSQCQRDIQDLFNSTFAEEEEEAETQQIQAKMEQLVALKAKQNSTRSNGSNSDEDRASPTKLNSSCSASPSLQRVLTPTSIIDSQFAFAPIKGASSAFSRRSRR